MLAIFMETLPIISHKTRDKDIRAIEQIQPFHTFRFWFGTNLRYCYRRYFVVRLKFKPNTFLPLADKSISKNLLDTFISLLLPFALLGGKQAASRPNIFASRCPNRRNDPLAGQCVAQPDHLRLIRTLHRSVGNGVEPDQVDFLIEQLD